MYYGKKEDTSLKFDIRMQQMNRLKNYLRELIVVKHNISLFMHWTHLLVSYLTEGMPNTYAYIHTHLLSCLVHNRLGGIPTLSLFVFQPLARNFHFSSNHFLGHMLVFRFLPLRP